MKRLASISLALPTTLALVSTIAAQQYTPAAYEITLYSVELSADGSSFQSVLDEAAGIPVDLADAASFTDSFSEEAFIAPGTYRWIRMTIDEQIIWSHPDAPVGLSDQLFTVIGGPPGSQPGQMTVYFATHDEGGLPGGDGGGSGTRDEPFLLGGDAEVVSGENTTLRIVFKLTNTLVDQGGGVYDLAPPEMFFVSENEDAAALSGDFTTTVYNATKATSSDGMGGQQIDAWSYASGRGTLTFDGLGGWSWSGTLNEFDLAGGAAGSVDTAAAMTGRYGINLDGSIWMTATGEPGTLRGAVSEDQTLLVASMFDSPTSHLMIFGVEPATSADNTTLSGDYYFTTYGTTYEAGPDRIEYRGAFGTVSSDGSGLLTGTEDSNSFTLLDPLGAATVSGPTVDLGDTIADTIAISADGGLTSSGGRALGAILGSGDAACLAFSFASPYEPNHQLGFIVRQSPAGTFNNASLRGTYLGAQFGDVGSSGGSTYFSGFFRVTFDGVGSATVTVLENREGTIESGSFVGAYNVDSATGFVSFLDESGSPEDLRGAVGPNALSFILAAVEEDDGQPNDQRFLGLGVRQD